MEEEGEQNPNELVSTLNVSLLYEAYPPLYTIG